MQNPFRKIPIAIPFSFPLSLCVHCASHSLTVSILWLVSVNLKSNNAPHLNAIASLSLFLLLPLAISHNIHALSSLFLSAWWLQCKFYAYCCCNWCLVRVFFLSCVSNIPCLPFSHTKKWICLNCFQIGKKNWAHNQHENLHVSQKIFNVLRKKPRLFMLIHVFFFCSWFFTHFC